MGIDRDAAAGEELHDGLDRLWTPHRLAYVAAGPKSILFASIWWPIGLALATFYFIFISRRYAGKVSVKRDNQGFY